MSHYTVKRMREGSDNCALRGDGPFIIHVDEDSDQSRARFLFHPGDSEFVWTRCCGMTAWKGEVLPEPLPCAQPLLNPDELARLEEMLSG